jgi:hypothetical protein
MNHHSPATALPAAASFGDNCICNSKVRNLDQLKLMAAKEKVWMDSSQSMVQRQTPFNMLSILRFS